MTRNAIAGVGSQCFRSIRRPTSSHQHSLEDIAYAFQALIQGIVSVSTPCSDGILRYIVSSQHLGTANVPSSLITCAAKLQTPRLGRFSKMQRRECALILGSLFRAGDRLSMHSQGCTLSLISRPPTPPRRLITPPVPVLHISQLLSRFLLLFLFSLCRTLPHNPAETYTQPSLPC